MQTNEKLKINMYYEDRTYEETTTIAKYSFQMSKIRDQSRSLFFLMKTLKYIIHVLFFKRILYIVHTYYITFTLYSVSDKFVNFVNVAQSCRGLRTLRTHTVDM